MAEIKLKAKTYSDVAYVEGMYKRDPLMEQALYMHCKRYFDENYRSIFFVGNEYKDEIFLETFIKLWENIEHRKIYVEDCILKGKGGKPFTSRLTTYFMSIARLKYLEWVRDIKKTFIPDDDGILWEKIDSDSYKDFLYDEEGNEIIEIIADFLGNMSKRCNQILTMFYYEEKALDDIIKELPTFKSKDALKTAKYKCLENLRKLVKETYYRYLNS